MRARAWEQWGPDLETMMSLLRLSRHGGVVRAREVPSTVKTCWVEPWGCLPAADGDAAAHDGSRPTRRTRWLDRGRSQVEWRGGARQKAPLENSDPDRRVRRQRPAYSRARAPTAMSPDGIVSPPQKQRQSPCPTDTATPDRRCPATRRRRNQFRQGTSSSVRTKKI